jgi:hypothetical protein
MPCLRYGSPDERKQLRVCVGRDCLAVRAHFPGRSTERCASPSIISNAGIEKFYAGLHLYLQPARGTGRQIGGLTDQDRPAAYALASRGLVSPVLVEHVTAIGSRARSGCATTGDAYRLPPPRRSRLRHDGGDGWHGHGWAGLRPATAPIRLPFRPMSTSRSFQFRQHRIAPHLGAGAGHHARPPAKDLGLSSSINVQQQRSSRASLLQRLAAIPNLDRD